MPEALTELRKLPILGQQAVDLMQRNQIVMTSLLGALKNDGDIKTALKVFLLLPGLFIFVFAFLCFLSFGFVFLLFFFVLFSYAIFIVI